MLLNWFRERGLADFAADLFDFARPIAGLLAQVLYLMEPVASTQHFRPQLLGHLLEDPEQMEDFIAELRKEDQGT